MAVKCPQQSVHMTSEACHWNLEKKKKSAFHMRVTGVRKLEQTEKVRQNISTVFLSVFKMIYLCPMKSMPLTSICSRRWVLPQNIKRHIWSTMQTSTYQKTASSTFYIHVQENPEQVNQQWMTAHLWSRGKAALVPRALSNCYALHGRCRQDLSIFIPQSSFQRDQTSVLEDCLSIPLPLGNKNRIVKKEGSLCFLSADK